MNIELIFYRMWSREMQHLYEEKYSINQMYDYRQKYSDQYLYAVNIEANNIMFLDALQDKINEGHKKCEFWLRGLISQYVRSITYKFDSDDKIEYYEDWINNTLWIIRSDYPMISKWCNEYLQLIKEYKNKRVTDTVYISDDILNKLETAHLLSSRFPPQWHPSKIALCAYFVDCYFSKSNPNDLWKIGQNLFNVKNLAQSKNNYLGNKNGKPKGFEVIDEILKSII